jgi:hypothetical protein
LERKWDESAMKIRLLEETDLEKVLDVIETAFPDEKISSSWSSQLN